MSIFATARQQADQHAADVHHCDHFSKRLAFIVCSNGAIQFVMQCNDCGEKVGTPIAHKKLSWEARMFAQAFDRSAHDNGRAVFYAERRNERSEAFWRTYNEYLNSPEWTARRNKILKRDKYQCKARRLHCTHNATQVHHLNYSNVGNEADSDLMSVCKTCHDEITEDSRRQWITM